MSARNRANVGDHHRVEASRDDRTGEVYVRVRRHKRGQPVSFTLSEWAEFTRMVRDGELGELIQAACAQPERAARSAVVDMQKPWAVSLPTGQVNTYELEADARDAVDLIRDTDSPECELRHFVDGQWVVVNVPEES